ncbi:tyrosine-type recombinase/integrase [Methylobacillus caricis]|uniref:tyrosine-type recombinase/integrase n=1 Tax=Methylobacillus caricis TaxID=1971611 RepID=UPI001CFFDF56|nr:tyrosine-type recombinase/integrase [Methylobacillus caricis]MCB5187396.1 tyrosine-type recombinase/integrase [Methylobacillus caricis]
MMKRYLTEGEQRLLLSAPKKFSDVLAQRDYAWMSLLNLTGFRVTEFSLLTVGCAHNALKLGYVFIPREHRKGKRKDHSKLVTQPVRDTLHELLNIRERMGYINHPDQPLVMSRNSKAMSVRSYQARVAHWAALAGLPDGVSPHWFRHTRAMNIMARTTSRDPRGIVQAELGHASIASTGIYTAVTREAMAAALNEVDGVVVRKRAVRQHTEWRAS